jgi:hypothetical protein
VPDCVSGQFLPKLGKQPIDVIVLDIGDGTDTSGQFTTELDRMAEIHDSQGQFPVFGTFLAEKYVILVYTGFG